MPPRIPTLLCHGTTSVGSESEENSWNSWGIQSMGELVKIASQVCLFFSSQYTLIENPTSSFQLFQILIFSCCLKSRDNPDEEQVWNRCCARESVTVQSFRNSSSRGFLKNAFSRSLKNAYVDFDFAARRHQYPKIHAFSLRDDFRGS
jgi:hypothetical protein